MIIARLTQDQLLNLIKQSDNFISEAKNIARDRLIATTDSPDILLRMFEEINMFEGVDSERAARQRLLSMLGKVTDEQMIERMLAVRSRIELRNIVDKPEQRIVLLRKLPQDKMVERVLKDIDDHDIDDWNRGRLSVLETGIAITAYVEDTKSIAKIVSAVLAKIAKHRERCKREWSMSWNSNDDKQAEKLIAGLPMLPDVVIAALICMDKTTWKYLIGRVTEESAYNILTKGKAKSDELEVALVKKLSAPKVDMKVFAGVKTDAGKKAVMAAMPDEVKKTALESTGKALANIMDKAKKASKDTFEMHGFYLGMDWDDMKLVIAHHFPDYKIDEARDGEGENASYVVYITKQSTPFCYASAKDKKIYQFNFGKQVLKKWYKYDVQTYMEWAQAYSKETGIDMRYKMLESDTEVYEFDMSASYKVWFHQETYQYKNNTKEYRLTYFGEEKDYTVHGGIGGAIIKSQAAKAFRYLRDDPGTLRARIERD